MEKSRVYFSLMLIAVFFWACSGGENAPKDERSELKNKIDSIEIFLFDKAQGKHVESMKRLKDAYVEYGNAYPEDETTPLFYFQAANLSQRLANYPEAISFYQKIVDDHPDFKNYVESYFLIGVIYDNNLKDKNNARRIYTEVAQKFPDHDFGKNAQTLLDSKIMDLDEDELIKFLEEKNKDKVTSEK